MDGQLVVGRFLGLFGVRGWLKVFSYTRPVENVGRYRPWHVNADGKTLELMPTDVRMHGKNVIAHVQGYEDRDAAAALMGCEIAIHRAQLPALDGGEFYWSQLIGLRVANPAGVDLGIVKGLLETGSADVLVIVGSDGVERLVPYVPDVYVLAVDTANGSLLVDWNLDY